MSETLQLLARFGLIATATAHGLASLTALGPRLERWSADARSEALVRRCAATAAYARNLAAAAAAAATHPEDFPPPAMPSSWRRAEAEARARLDAAQGEAYGGIIAEADGRCTAPGGSIETHLHEERNPNLPQPWPNFVYRFGALGAPGAGGTRGAISLLCMGFVAMLLLGALWASTDAALRRVAEDLARLDGPPEATRCADLAPEARDCAPRAIDHRRGGSAAFCVLQRLREDAAFGGEEDLCD